MSSEAKLTEMLLKLAEYKNIFSVLSALIINDLSQTTHLIKLIKEAESLYLLIYNLSVLELKSLREYIENSLQKE